MKYPYFSYDPDDGFLVHETKEGAINACNQAIDGFRDNAGDGWDEDVTDICWGEIKQRATMCDKQPIPVDEDDEEPEFEYSCDYRLEEIVSTFLSSITTEDLVRELSGREGVIIPHPDLWYGVINKEIQCGKFPKILVVKE